MTRLNVKTIFKSSELRSDLSKKTIRGGMSMMTAQAIQLFLSTGSTVILARLLTPKDFGLVAMVTVVIAFAVMFKDAGLSMATVQKDKISHAQISTLFWINFFISSALGICVLLFSPLVAMFYGRPELTAVTAALSSTFIISGLTIQHEALLRRHMLFSTLAITNIAVHTISIGVTIILALLGWSYWALVGGTITDALLRTVLTFFFCPWVPGRIRKGTNVRSMLAFGGHLTGFSFVNYFHRNLDNILIGKFIGIDALGMYSKAYGLFMKPITQIRQPMINVAMPALSILNKEPDRYIHYYKRFLDILATITIPITLYCVIEADFLISLLLGPQWLEAIPVFKVLAIAGMIQPVSSTMGLILLSLGLSKKYLYWGLANAIVMIIAIIVGLPFGIIGVATSYTIANYLILFPSLFYCFHKTPVTVGLFIKTLTMPFLISLFAAGTLFSVRHFYSNESIVLHLLLLSIFMLVYACISCFRKSVREAIMMFYKNSPFFSRKKSI